MTHDAYELSYVPRPLPDGSVAICQEHVTDSLQALMKADYMLALNSGTTSAAASSAGGIFC